MRKAGIFKKNKGFTLIELMIVIIIIGILVAIAVPNFMGAMERAKISSIKSNMKTTQVMVETYGVDYGGIYPGTRNELANEAESKGYWKDFYNPYTHKLNSIVDTTMIADPEDLKAGTIVYFGSGTPGIEDVVTPSADSYTIYGLMVDKDGEVDLIRKNGRERFYLTNS